LTGPRLTHITNAEAASFPGCFGVTSIFEITLHYNHDTKVTSFTGEMTAGFSHPHNLKRNHEPTIIQNASDFPGGNLT
jgi:hypothetical protein